VDPIASRILAVPLPEDLVAATALERGLQLMTGNLKDFPMEDLVLFPVPMMR